MSSTAKIRVGIYADMDPSMGGQYQYALSVVEALASLGEDFEVVCYCSRLVWRERCESLGIKWKRVLPFGIGGKFFAKIIRDLASAPVVPNWYRGIFIRQVVADGLDVCVFPMPTTLVKDMPVATICAIHDLMFKYEKRFRAIDGFFSDDYYYELFNTITAETTIVLVDSDVGVTHVEETTKPGRARLRILPFCAPRYVGKYLESLKKEPEALSRRISERVHDCVKVPYIFYPAIVRPDKNHKNLIQAVKILHDEGLAVNAVFTGNIGPMSQIIFDEVDACELNDRVEFLPYITDEELCYLFSHAQALVMPTYAGPTNIPQLEAFALGCPVLTSDIYGMPGQIGQAGILFDPDSPKEIADSVRRIWLNDDERSRLTELGFERNEALSFTMFRSRLAGLVIEAIDLSE